MTKIKNFLKPLGLSIAAIALTATVALAADSVVTVTPNDLEDSKVDAYFSGSWFIYNDETDTIDNSLASFVMGPDTAPEGMGSVEMSVSGTERVNVATYRFSGTPLADITTLAYSTYNPSAGNGGSADRSGYLHFNVDFDGSDTWQSRLVYVPRDNGTVMQDEWQEWDALNNGDALWRYSGSVWPGTTDPGLSTTKTWDEILAMYPDARVRVTDSFMGVRVGEPYANGYTENVDAFKFGTADGTTTFDFEPLVGPPTDKDECKKDGWMSFNNPSFKNQGQCIQYVNTGK